jgi:hypothetical protein
VERRGGEIGESIRSMLGDRRRLFEHGFKSKEDLFNASGVDGSTIRRDLRRGTFGYGSIRKLLHYISSKDERDIILTTLEIESAKRSLKRISLQRILSVSDNDYDTWFSYVNKICAANSVDLPSSIEDVNLIISKSIAPMRLRGEFFNSALYALSFIMWLINSGRKIGDDSARNSVLATLLIQLARSSGQAGIYSLHGKAVRLVEKLLSYTNKNAKIVRVVQDSRAQCITTYSNSRRLLKDALRIHEEENNIASYMLENSLNEFTSIDDYFVCFESFYNYISLKAKIFGYKSIDYDFDHYMERLELAKEYCNRKLWESELTDISVETEVVAKLFTARIDAANGNFEKAISTCKSIGAMTVLSYEMQRKIERNTDLYKMSICN